MMKKLLLIKSLILISTLGFSQSNLTNPGFENWVVNSKSTPNVYIEPEAWSYSVCVGQTGGPFSCELFGDRSTDAHSGSYALKLNNTLKNLGAAMLGTDNSPVLAFTSKPSAMNMFIKNTFLGGDYLKFQITFLTVINGKTVSKSILDSVTANNSAYTKFSIPISLDFDPLYIMAYISFKNASKKGDVNSFALIDDISFDLVSGIENEKLETDLLTFYPNPVINELNLSKEVNYTLSNMYGQAIASGFGDKINTSTLSKGIYLLQYQNSGNKKMTKTFVKE